MSERVVFTKSGTKTYTEKMGEFMSKMNRKGFCPFYDEMHKVQCKAPAFSPLTPSGCEGYPFQAKCTVPALAWRKMLTVPQIEQIAALLRTKASLLERNSDE